MPMTAKKPRIVSLKPVVLADKRRVTLEMVVEDLPTTFANIMLTLPDRFDPPPVNPPQHAADTPSPYPNIELSILNRRRQQVASLFIVEHKEKFIALTLHLPAPDVTEEYTARAEMTLQDEVIEVVEQLFTLSQAN